MCISVELDVVCVVARENPVAYPVIISLCSAVKLMQSFYLADACRCLQMCLDPCQ